MPQDQLQNHSQVSLLAVVSAARASRQAYADAAALFMDLQRQQAAGLLPCGPEGSFTERTMSAAFGRLLEATLESRRAYLLARSLAVELMNAQGDMARAGGRRVRLD